MYRYMLMYVITMPSKQHLLGFDKSGKCGIYLLRPWLQEEILIGICNKSSLLSGKKLNLKRSFKRAFGKSQEISAGKLFRRFWDLDGQVGGRTVGRGGSGKLREHRTCEHFQLLHG